MNKHSLKKNTIANYVGQLYSMLIVIIITPLYLTYLGAEAYGLIGFFVLMQTWLNLLDVGLSATLGREVAYSKGKNNLGLEFRKLVKCFESIFLILVTLIFFSVFISSEIISEKWINAENIKSETIEYCIVFMGLIICFRWFTTLYKSGLNGFEDQIWINGINILINSLKYLGALFLFMFYSIDIKTFFLYQLLVGLFESFVFLKRFYSVIPPINTRLSPFLIDKKILEKISPFTFSIAITTIIWTFLTQFDKLLLSNLLTLKEFGYFSLVLLLTNAIVALSTPIFLAFIPRITILISEQKENEMIILYKNMTQFICLIIFSTSLIIANYSEEILFVLTGDVFASKWAADILFWFSLGYSFFIFSGIQYYLQNAFGDLKLYLYSTSIAAVVQIPLIYYTTINYGAIGAGKIWFIFAVIWFLISTYLVHNKFIKNFHFNWLIKDIVPIMVILTIVILIINSSFKIDLLNSRAEIFIRISISGLILLLFGSLGLNIVKNRILTKEIK